MYIIEKTKQILSLRVNSLMRECFVGEPSFKCIYWMGKYIDNQFKICSHLKGIYECEGGRYYSCHSDECLIAYYHLHWGKWWSPKQPVPITLTLGCGQTLSSVDAWASAEMFALQAATLSRMVTNVVP